MQCLCKYICMHLWRNPRGFSCLMARLCFYMQNSFLTRLRGPSQLASPCVFIGCKAISPALVNHFVLLEAVFCMMVSVYILLLTAEDLREIYCVLSALGTVIIWHKRLLRQARIAMSTACSRKSLFLTT